MVVVVIIIVVITDWRCPSIFGRLADGATPNEPHPVEHSKAEMAPERLVRWKRFD
jgi:hypothetical protein